MPTFTTVICVTLYMYMCLHFSRSALEINTEKLRSPTQEIGFSCFGAKFRRKTSHFHADSILRAARVS